jgi:O-antigen/teichoic acid export membrane protein
MKLLGNSFFSVVFSGFTHVLNYAFVLTCLHFLSTSEYANLSLILSFYTIIGVFGSTLATAGLAQLSQVTEDEQRQIKEKIMSTSKVLFVTLSLFSIFVLTPFIYFFFKLDSLFSIALLLLAGVLSIGLNMLTLHFQLMQEFIRNGLMSIVSTTFKLIVSFIALYFGFGILGVGMSLLLGTICCFLIFYPRSENKLLLETSSLLILKNTKNFILENKNLLEKSFYASLVLVLCVTLDTILVKKILSETLSAQYIGLATLAKLFLYGNVAIATVLFPYCLQYIKNNSRELADKVFNLYNMFIVVSGFIGFVIVYFYHKFFVHLIIGAKYLDSSLYLPNIFVVIVFTTLAYSTSQYAALTNAKNFLKVISYYFVFFIISFCLYIYLLSPNLNAVNIASLANFLSLMFAILSFCIYFFSIRKD